MNHPDDSELQRLYHELLVHQAEIELQNDSLREISQDLARSRDRFAALFENAPVGFLELDHHGLVLTANRHAADLLFVGPEEPIGRPIVAYLSPESATVLDDALTRLDDALTRPGEAEPIASLELVAGQGERQRSLRTEVKVLKAGDDGARRLLVALIDISREKEAEARVSALLASERRSAALRRAEERHIARLARLGSLYLETGRLIDVLGEILDAALEIAGTEFAAIRFYAPRTDQLELVAQRGFPDWWVEQARAVRLLDDGCGKKLAQRSSLMVDDLGRDPDDGALPSFALDRRAGVRSLKAIPLVSRSAQMLGAITVYFSEPGIVDERVTGLLELLARRAADIIDRDRVDAALRAQEEHLRVAAKAARFGTFSANLVNDATYWSPELCELLGLPPDTTPPPATVVPDFVHPDDVTRVEAAYARALDPASPGNIGVENRVVLPDGRVHWVQVRGQVEFTEQDGARTPFRAYGIVLDINERKEAELALVEADRRKNEFLAVLAHELRNPLAPIGNALDLLRLTDSDNVESASARDTIERQLDHLVRLVDDLLDVNRITHGQLQLRRQRVELRPLLEQTLDALRPQLAEAGLELSVTLPARAIHLVADPVRVAQIIYNLVNNAVKYTPVGGRIALSASRAGQQALVTVEDNGIGMSAPTLARVFEMFFRVDEAMAHGGGGLGIGLWLARHLVDLHGGTIEAQSDGPGCGSRFVLRLPVAVEAGAVRPPGKAAQPATDKARRILVVDDNRDITESLSQLLRLLGHQVDVLPDGAQAVARVAADPPEVVLLDIGMPGLDGYETCRLLRALPNGGNLLILALTGFGQEDDRRRAEAAGFDGHLLKPVRLATLQKAIARRALPGS